MTTKDKILFLVFLFAISTIVIDKIFLTTLTVQDFFIKLILLSGSIAYIGIYLVYIIVVKKYNELKKIFYDDYLFVVRGSIAGNKKLWKELVGYYIVSCTLNFFILYFLSITPISSLLESIPGLEQMKISSLDYSIFTIDFLGKTNEIIIFVPFISIGAIFLFILRCISRKEHNLKDKNYPGSRAVVGFGYVMLVAIFINYAIVDENVNHDQIAFNNSEFHLTTSLAFILSVLSFFVVIVIVVTDRLLIQGKNG